MYLIDNIKMENEGFNPFPSCGHQTAFYSKDFDQNFQVYYEQHPQNFNNLNNHSHYSRNIFVKTPDYFRNNEMNFSSFPSSSSPPFYSDCLYQEAQMQSVLEERKYQDCLNNVGMKFYGGLPGHCSINFGHISVDEDINDPLVRRVQEGLCHETNSMNVRSPSSEDSSGKFF